MLRGNSLNWARIALLGNLGTKSVSASYLTRGFPAFVILVHSGWKLCNITWSNIILSTSCLSGQLLWLSPEVSAQKCLQLCHPSFIHESRLFLVTLVRELSNEHGSTGAHQTSSSPLTRTCRKFRAGIPQLCNPLNPRACPSSPVNLLRPWLLARREVNAAGSRLQRQGAFTRWFLLLGGSVSLVLGYGRLLVFSLFLWISLCNSMRRS